MTISAAPVVDGLSGPIRRDWKMASLGICSRRPGCCWLLVLLPTDESTTPDALDTIRLIIRQRNLDGGPATQPAGAPNTHDSGQAETRSPARGEWDQGHARGSSPAGQLSERPALTVLSHSVCESQSSLMRFLEL